MAHLFRSLTKTLPTALSSTKIHRLRRLSTAKNSFDDDNFELPPNLFTEMPTGREKSRNEFMTRGPPYAWDRWYEPDGSVVYRFDVPGVSKDGVTLFVEGDILYWEGRASKDPAEETGRLFRFMMQSCNNDVARVRAEISNGVLYLNLPKLN